MKILLVGANGRMGRKMQEVLREKHIDFVGIDKDNRALANDFDATVLLDFSSANCLEENLALARKKHIPVVVATTNHIKSGVQKMEKFKEELPIFVSSNFSILFHYLKKCLSVLPQNFETIIEETHHKNKKDSPSGSGKELQKILKTQNVTSFRVSNVIGQHVVKIFSQSEILMFSHTVFDLEVFCLGAIKACEFVENKKCGMFSMDDL